MAGAQVKVGYARFSQGQVEVRVYAELNDFLPLTLRQVSFTYPLSVGETVKDLIESVGIPHVEVDLILVNGESVDWTYRPSDGDHISVYPVFETLDIASLQRLRPRPLREVRFVADVHLGRLVAYLRLLGFDTLYERTASDEELASWSAEERRVLLTRDRELLKRRKVTHGYWVRAVTPRQQLLEVVRRFDLLNSLKLFERCPRCNGLVERVEREEVVEQVPPRSWFSAKAFSRCRQCGQVYCEGTHTERIRGLIAWLQQEIAPLHQP